MPDPTRGITHHVRRPDPDEFDVDHRNSQHQPRRLSDASPMAAGTHNSLSRTATRRHELEHTGDNNDRRQPNTVTEQPHPRRPAEAHHPTVTSAKRSSARQCEPSLHAFGELSPEWTRWWLVSGQPRHLRARSGVHAAGYAVNGGQPPKRRVISRPISATTPARSIAALGLPKLSVHPTPNRRGTSSARSSRLM